MIISEQRFASQARFGPGKVEKYDDISCLVERLSKGAAPTEIWVADAKSEQWFEAPKAHYVRARDFKTPMASGLVAFGRRSDAEDFAKEHGTTVTSLVDLRKNPHIDGSSPQSRSSQRSP